MCIRDRLKGVKLVTTLHNRADEDFVNVYGKIVGGYMIRRYYRALRQFDKNIAVSESTAELYERKLSNVSYVNNGVDVDKFSVISKEAQQQLRLKCHLPTQAIILVSSGRIEREKRYEELIQWFSVFTHTNPNYILLILGDGSRLDACKAMANDKVVFTGRVSNVVDYLQCADYYISNSQSEGMSMAVCEGMSCGLFPILSDIPAHRNVAEGVGGVPVSYTHLVGGFVMMFSFLSSSLNSSISRFLTFQLGRCNSDALHEVFFTSISIQVILSFLILFLAETLGLWFLATKMVIPIERYQAAFWVFQFSIFSFCIGLLSICLLYTSRCV